jgi:hypothetical protein
MPESGFKFEVNLRISRLTGQVTVQEPGLISDQILDKAWQLMNDFVIDVLDELGVEPTDEQEREVFCEICYRILYREMFALLIAPHWEQSWQDRLGTNKRGPHVRRKGEYDDTWEEL